MLCKPAISPAIEVVELQEHRNLASSEQMIAIPTLIRKLPAPIRVLAVDLSDRLFNAKICLG